ncbi:MAG: TIR domain-containing protein [Hyphomicrobiaceae bacterium]
MLEPIVFVSYRRSDSQHATGRLRTRLVPRHFSDPEVFMDVSDIDKGVDFVEKLNGQLECCQVALVVIGKTWLTATNANGQRRIDDPGDFVASEVAAFMMRGIPVIPVLVDEAKMPSAAELPERLKHLASRNATFLVHERFEQDADALAREVKRLVGRPDDAELDVLKLLFSFKGFATRKQFWTGIGPLLLVQLVVLLGLLWAMDLPVMASFLNLEMLPFKQQVLIQMAMLPFLWPTLAIAWKRVRDLGHGWGFFVPVAGAGAAQTWFALTNNPADAQTASMVCLVLLLVLGAIKGTRFVSDGAAD